MVAALLEGGDSRIGVDPVSGTNKYLCPPLPSPDLVCLSSCTASPIGLRGLRAALHAFHTIAGAESPRLRQQRLAERQDDVVRVVASTLGLAGAAHVLLCPSGTDALLTAAAMVAAERPGAPLTAILPAAAETGTGVPLAATCRRFDGPNAGMPLAPGVMRAVEIPLRDAEALPRDPSEVNDAFSNAAARLPGRPIIYLTHGTKTGLIAPMVPRAGEDVIVDACQGRIEPAQVGAYLNRGWPVIVTGSKFFGGPPFSGAVLFPTARLRRAAARPASLGTLLRWAASLPVMEAFTARSDAIRSILQARMHRIAQALARIPGVVPVATLPSGGSGWSDVASICTFALRDPARPRRLLTAVELQPIYRHAARSGVLLGQPVTLGAFGGLRVAVGARDLLDDTGEERVLLRLEGAFTHARAAPAVAQEDSHSVRCHAKR